MKIIVLKRENEDRDARCRVCIADRPDIYSGGRFTVDALGSLVLAHSQEFGIELEIIEVGRTCQSTFSAETRQAIAALEEHMNVPPNRRLANTETPAQQDEARARAILRECGPPSKEDRLAEFPDPPKSPFAVIEAEKF